MRKLLIVLMCTVLLTACSETHKEYYEDGSLMFEGEVDDNLLRNGHGKFYYTNGNIEQEGIYKDDKEEGLFKFYYETGNLKQETNYRNGKAEGLVKEYYETGELSTEVYFKKGKQEGELKEYYRNGELKSIQNFKEGVPYGFFKSYYLNGQLEMEAFSSNEKTDYYIKYDSLGNWTDESRIFDISIAGDTIYLGETVEIEFDLNGPIEDSVFVSMNIHNYDNPSKSSNPEMFNLKENKYHLTFTPDIAGKWGCLGYFTIGKEAGRKFDMPLTSFYVLEKEELLN